MSEKIEPLSYDNLSSMQKNDYLKLFKKPTNWKKKKAVIFISKYKFGNGKLPLVALPVKKYNDAAKLYKDKIKREFSEKFLLLAELELTKNEEGELLAKITPKKGKAQIKETATALFEKLKAKVEFTNEEENSPSPSIEEPRNEEHTDLISSTQLQTIQKNVEKLSGVNIATLSSDKKETIMDKLEQYVQLLASNPNAEEEELVSNLSEKVAQLLEKFNAEESTTVSQERMKEIEADVLKYAAYVDKVLTQLPT